MIEFPGLRNWTNCRIINRWRNVVKEGLSKDHELSFKVPMGHPGGHVKWTIRYMSQKLGLEIIHLEIGIIKMVTDTVRR